MKRSAVWKSFRNRGRWDALSCFARRSSRWRTRNMIRGCTSTANPVAGRTLPDLSATSTGRPGTPQSGGSTSTSAMSRENHRLSALCGGAAKKKPVLLRGLTVLLTGQTRLKLLGTGARKGCSVHQKGPCWPSGSSDRSSHRYTYSLPGVGLKNGSEQIAGKARMREALALANPMET